MPSMAEILVLREENLADDVPLVDGLETWTSAQVAEYFESLPHATQALEPFWPWAYPFGQMEQEVAFALAWYWPALQTVQACSPASSVYWPFGQAVHAVIPREDAAL